MTREPGHALLAVHAHPDDESLWTGGLLARYAARGRATAVVTCTNGELADGTSAAAPGTRVGELAEALGVLGVAESSVLPYRDSGHLGAGRGSLCAAPFDELVTRLVERIRALRPAAVVTYDAAGISGHPDHVRVHRAVLAAVEAAANRYVEPEAGPAWAAPSLWLATIAESRLRAAAGPPSDAVSDTTAPPSLPCTPDERIAAVVDVRPWLDVKWAAVRAHASEFARGGRVTAFEDARLRELFLGTEWYLFRPGPGAAPAAGPGDLLAP
ncbi:PIG-L family deacetylase [Streptacidiphilus rugosus]|uniref:PIG-L family deacetylase n=1 Tax=Streptacidiphilus rugosus TaxID=405783 RepID=UPI0005692000|nr:PIG-L family deacetylase [Streptacidiphilus rugosus]